MQFLPTRATSKWGILTAKVDPEEPWNGGIQNWAAANDALDLRSDTDWQNWKAGGTIAEAVCRMFSPDYHSSWDSFATTLNTPRGKGDATKPGYLSLEFIHNKIHVSFFIMIENKMELQLTCIRTGQEVLRQEQVRVI